MSHPYHHAVSSARNFGGKPEDYLEIHNWLDESKKSFCGVQHRLLRHHSEGIFEAERVLGITIVNSDGKTVPIRYVAEQHILEDCGRVPSLADWLRNLRLEAWMSRATSIQERGEVGYEEK